ncbi:MAG: hypothetical protein ACKVE3_07025 [Dissulfuribacterales bacterium]
MKHRNIVEEYLFDAIVDDDSYIIDFLDNRDDLEYQVSEQLNDLTDEDIEDAWETYCGYYTIEEFLEDQLGD